AAVDEGWLRDRGRYAYPGMDHGERITTPLIRGGRGLEAVSNETVLEHIADRLRATVERFGAGSVAVVASGEQTNEEAHLWSRILEGLGGGVSVAGAESGPWRDGLEPYAASIADGGRARTLVVSGYPDLGH